MEHAKQNNILHHIQLLRATDGTPEVATSPVQACLVAHRFLLVHQNMQQPVDEIISKKQCT